jgi:multidrug efflux system outer membrane protein
MNEPTPQEQEPIMKIPSLSKLPRRLLPLVAALALAGCASVSQSLPEVPAAPAFKEQGAAPQAGWTQALPAEAQARGQWWLAFADPALDALVDKATLDNQGIQAAAARLAEARALARSANAERLPQIGVGAGATRGAGLDKASGTRPATLVNAGLNLSYEVDLFGRISQAADASRLDAEGLEALLQSTRLAVQAEVAQTYLQLRALDARSSMRWPCWWGTRLRASA